MRNGSLEATVETQPLFVGYSSENGYIRETNLFIASNSSILFRYFDNLFNEPIP